MVTDAMIAAARDEFIAVAHESYFPSNDQIRCVLEAAEKAAAWQEARVTSADFVSDDTRDEDDERPEGCYVTVRMPLNTKIRAGIARIVLPSPLEPSP